MPSVPPSEEEQRFIKQFQRRLQALGRGQTLSTTFFDPRRLELAEALVREEGGLFCTVYGGYSGAERNALQIFPAGHKQSLPPVSAVRVTWQDREGPGHRDLLGAILALGMRRDQVGDIVISGEREAIVFILEEFLPLVTAELVRAGSVDLQCEPFAPDDLQLPAGEGREIKGTVASMRLDAIVALGFGISRSRVVLLVKSGLARVNWRPVDSPAFQLAEGDTISLRGRGRLVVSATEGKTRKGRFRVSLRRCG